MHYALVLMYKIVTINFMIFMYIFIKKKWFIEKALNIYPCFIWMTFVIVILREIQNQSYIPNLTNSQESIETMCTIADLLRLVLHTLNRVNKYWP